MNREPKTENVDNDEKVINHLQRADYLLMFLPMVLAASLLIVVPFGLLITDKMKITSGIISQYNFSGMLIPINMIIWVIFCVTYGLPAFILAIAISRKWIFRLLLIIILFFAANLLYRSFI